MINYNKVLPPLLFYGGLIYYLYQSAASGMLSGVCATLLTTAFINLINAKDNTDAALIIECLILSLVAFLLS